MIVLFGFLKSRFYKGIYMYRQKPGAGKILLVVLSVLALITFVLFVMFFLPFGSRDREDETKAPGASLNAPSDTSSIDRSAIDAEIAQHQTQMEAYQKQLNSTLLLVVNEENPLPEDYSVSLTELAEANGFSLASSAAEALDQLLRSAVAAGYSPQLSAAYRTEKEQAALFDGAVQSSMSAGYPVDQARKSAAADVGSAGCSEHQTGFAFDFRADNLSETADGVPFSDFLKENAAGYGFVLSAPSNEKDRSGLQSSLVHYRYVGTEAAAAMSEKGISLMEYREYLKSRIEYENQQIESLRKQ